VKDTPNGRKVVQFKDDCIGYNAKRADYEARGPFDWIADEGEDFKELGSTSRDETVPGEGLKRFIDSKVITSKIAEFPRPKDNPSLAQQAFANEITDQEVARRRSNRSDVALSLEAQATTAGKGKR
jgi:hypothetical protein